MNKYIDKNTFEIVDNVFEVDEDIAETISILNKKGYYTLYSCSGHVKDPRLYEKYIVQKNDGDNLIDSYIVDKEQKSYSVLKPYTFTVVYIKFDKDYKFNNLPNGFTKKDDNIIEKIINYYDNGKKIKSDVIDQEINFSNKILLEWAKKLPNL
ncbi:MAG: hypothetical protein IJY25_06390 [Bacilli bacterium]|nr:hypothetical protein [Bacilli bacterium]